MRDTNLEKYIIESLPELPLETIKQNLINNGYTPEAVDEAVANVNRENPPGGFNQRKVPPTNPKPPLASPKAGYLPEIPRNLGKKERRPLDVPK